MTAARISPFGGMIPATDETLLPEINASLAKNTWVYQGTVQGIPTPKVLRTNTDDTITKVYRIPNNYTDAQHLVDSVWMEFTNIDTDVVRSVVVDDAFDRYYWAAPSLVPQYNTRARIANGDPSFTLGVPQPPTPILNIVGGVSATQRSTAYVLTYVSAYGEEGPPSNPTEGTGKVDASWNLTWAAADPNDLGVTRNLTLVRIYRTVTALDGTTTYFFVDEKPIATVSYSDTKTDAQVSLNELLSSTTWAAPPTDMVGLISLSNGMLAGFRKNEVWFCEPYRPHAWPAQYTITTEFPIVGLGVMGQTLVVLTQGYIHTATGISPSNISIVKLAGILPCTSRGGILSAPEGVYFPSPSGLILVSGAGVLNVTKELIRKDKWLEYAQTSTLRAVRLNNAYYGFGSARFGVFDVNAFDNDAFTQEDFSGARAGILIDPTSQSIAFNILSSEDAIVNVMTDAWSGEVFIIRNGETQWIDIGEVNAVRDPYVWRSKLFQAEDKKNFVAQKVYFNSPSWLPTLNPVPNASLVQALADDQWGLVRCYADGRLVHTRELRVSGEQMRLPSGFKADFWQWEIEARVELKSFQAATSTDELRQV
jgi:hypothetical protein